MAHHSRERLASDSPGFGYRAAAIIAALVLSLAFGSAARADFRPPAPDFECSPCLNAKPFKLDQLRGKVVLVDFWEYTCINCIRTFPHLRRWNRLYGPLGLVIVAVHTPEFAFAKDKARVASAAKRFGFNFPVAIDSDYVIWNKFNNEAWPADYLIDANGDIAYTHEGEGDYAGMERHIQELLRQANPKLDFSAARFKIPPDKPEVGGVCLPSTPETYLGYARAASIANPGGEDRMREIAYQLAGDVPPNSFALQGPWIATSQAVEHVSAGQAASLLLHYESKSVYMVAGSDDAKGKKVYITQDGDPLALNARGVDVRQDTNGATYIMLSNKRMYYLVANPHFGDHLLKLTSKDAPLSLYSFTFGNNCETAFAHK